MKNFYPARVLSGLALLFFLWSVLLDWHFVLDEWNLSVGQVGLAGLVYVAILAGWIVALLLASGTHRGALIGLTAYALLLTAYAIMDLVVYCPETCGRIWLYYLANWGNLLTGIAAALALFLKLRKRTSSENASSRDT